MMRSSTDVIESQPKGGFACSIRGVTTGAVPLRFPFGALENYGRMSAEEWALLRDKQRSTYANHYSALYEADGVEDEDSAEDVYSDPASEDATEPPDTPSPDDVDITPSTEW